MNTRMIRTLGVAAAVGICVAAQPLIAQEIDFSDGEEAGNQVIGFVRGPLATIVFVLAFAVTGFLASFNRISWVWVGGVVLGAFLVFGGPSFVDQLRGLFS